jgi:Nucleotidyl transferase AbiEii toxin, Type IV TA system
MGVGGGLLKQGHGGVAVVEESASSLTAFQIEVGQLFFSLPESAGYLLAGGAALAASALTSRPTQDLDFFTHGPNVEVSAARDALVRAAERCGWSVTLVHDSASFCRLVIHGREELLIDLAVDSPPTALPTVTVLGPTLAPLELAGRKLLALFGRAEARDFADVFVLAPRFGKDALLDQAGLIDEGFERKVLAQMMNALGRFGDDEIPIHTGAVGELRRFFAEWASELDTSPFTLQKPSAKDPT